MTESNDFKVNQVYEMDALTCTSAMRDANFRVNCVVTSPPYFGQRSYTENDEREIGKETTPEAYVVALVEIFRGVRDVLTDDGTFWLNLGDSYGHGTSAKRNRSMTSTKISDEQHLAQGGRHGGEAKQLLMIPARVALALQAEGWILRSDIIWEKPNSMPESVSDRPTKAHEYLFLLTKRANYWYDADAIAEESAPSSLARAKYNGIETLRPKATQGVIDGVFCGVPSMAKAYGQGRNKRSVWTIPTQSFAGAHFAVMPEALVEPCILAGCPVGGVVYDPFFGSGTVGRVARRLGRNYVGSEINPEYVALSRESLRMPFEEHYIQPDEEEVDNSPLARFLAGRENNGSNP